MFFEWFWDVFHTCLHACYNNACKMHDLVIYLYMHVMWTSYRGHTPYLYMVQVCTVYVKCMFPTWYVHCECIVYKCFKQYTCLLYTWCIHASTWSMPGCYGVPINECISSNGPVAHKRWNFDEDED